MTPTPEAVRAANRYYSPSVPGGHAALVNIIDSEFASLHSRLAEAETNYKTALDGACHEIAMRESTEARLAEAEGYLLGLTVDDAMWPNHKDCICGECVLLRDIRAWLARKEATP